MMCRWSHLCLRSLSVTARTFGDGKLKAVLQLSSSFCTSPSAQTRGEGTTHFGFETVTENLKSEKVQNVFSSVAPNYDLMNDLMSFGIHRLWKDKFMSVLNPKPGMKLLDVAGGTGDIAHRFLRYTQPNLSEQSNDDDSFDVSDPMCMESDDLSNDEQINEKLSHVTICDINQDMLDAGKKRNMAEQYKDSISWVCGDAENLPMKDNSFDAYAIAFGMRNTVHYDKVLSEARRVLKPGGRFLCLEFSQVEMLPLRMLYDAYSFQVIPVLGQVFARDWHSYQYLVESIRKFPSQEEFKALMEGSGFKMASYVNLSSGIVAIHSGFKV